MEKQKIAANIWKLYCIRAARSFMLAIPVIVLFFKENGMSMQQVFLLQALFSVAVIVLEIPTGYFADLFGRKRSILIGGAFASLGFVVYSLSYGFWGFLLAEIILGIGMSFVSGADSAMLFDTLLVLEREYEYKHFSGRSCSLGMFAEGIASIVGGLLALVSLRFPLYCDAITILVIIPLANSLLEPPRKKNRIQQSMFKEIWQIMRHSFEEMCRLVRYSLHEHGEMKWLIVYSALVSASTLTMVWFIQVYLVATKVPVSLFGIIWASLLFVAALVAFRVHDIEKFLGRKMSLVIMIILPVAGYFLLSSFWQWWSGIFIALFYFTRGINNSITEDYINGLVSSDVRATILSIKSLVGRLMFSIIGPVVGWVNDAASLKAALISSGLIFLTLGTVALFFMQRHKAL